MYYEEAVINGVLCWRGTPDGEWKPLTLKELTDRVTHTKARLTRLEAAVQSVLREARHGEPNGYKDWLVKLLEHALAEPQGGGDGG